MTTYKLRYSDKINFKSVFGAPTLEDFLLIAPNGETLLINPVNVTEDVADNFGQFTILPTRQISILCKPEDNTRLHLFIRDNILRR